MTTIGSDVGASITRIPVSVDTRAPGGATNAYLVDGLLVDPAARTDDLDEAIAAHDPGVDAIAVTHTHTDHVGGVADYAVETGATVYAHADHVERFSDATGIEPDATFRDGDALGDALGDAGGLDEADVPGETSGPGEADVVAFDTPGHASDHVAFVVEESGPEGARDALLVGDLAVAEGSVVVGGPDADLRAYLNGLERVRDGDFHRLYPGHGPPIDDPVATCQRLVDHRLARERKVYAAVERGASDVDGILDAAYEKDLDGIEDLARATVVAHLEKLVSEGRIDESWTHDP